MIFYRISISSFLFLSFFASKNWFVQLGREHGWFISPTSSFFLRMILMIMIYSKCYCWLTDKCWHELYRSSSWLNESNFFSFAQPIKPIEKWVFILFFVKCIKCWHANLMEKPTHSKYCSTLFFRTSNLKGGQIKRGAGMKATSVTSSFTRSFVTIFVYSTLGCL